MPRHAVDHAHDGGVVTLRFKLGWCSDGIEVARWTGDVGPGAFVFGAHDREVIARRAVANAGVRCSDIEGMMLEAVGTRLGIRRARQLIEILTDKGPT